MKSIGLFLDKSILFFCFIASAVCVLTVPIGHSVQFCVFCAIIYLISMIITVNNCLRNNGYLGLCTLIFMIVYFATNYLYPLFFAINDPKMLIFAYDFADQYINKGTAIATFGGVSFMLGCFCNRPIINKHISLQNDNKIKYINRIHSYEIFIVVVATLLLLYSNMDSILSRTYSTTAQFEDKTASSYLKIIYFYLFYLVFKDFCRLAGKATSLRCFLKKCCKPIHIAVVVIVLMNLYVGGRSLALSFFVLYPLCFTILIKRISPINLILGGVIAIVVLFVVGRIRGDVEVTANDAIQTSSLVYYFQDLAINSRSLYELIDYADAHGATWGQTMLLDICSYIPFGQSVFMKITGLSLVDISSPHLVTYMFFGSHPELGLGTNLVGDIYVAFKILGVFVLMYLLGYALYIISRKARFNIVYMLMFAMLSTQIVFVIRNGYCSLWRYVIWGLVLYSMDKYIYIHMLYRK